MIGIDDFEGQSAVPMIPEDLGHPPSQKPPGSFERATYWYLMLCRCRAIRFECRLDNILETAAIGRSIITDQAR